MSDPAGPRDPTGEMVAALHALGIMVVRGPTAGAEEWARRFGWPTVAGSGRVSGPASGTVN